MTLLPSDYANLFGAEFLTRFPSAGAEHPRQGFAAGWNSLGSRSLKVTRQTGHSWM